MGPLWDEEFNAMDSSLLLPFFVRVITQSPGPRMTARSTSDREYD